MKYAQELYKLNMSDKLGGLFLAWVVYVIFILLLIVIPAGLNFSLGVRHFYTKFLEKIIKVCVIFSKAKESFALFNFLVEIHNVFQ